MVLSHDTQASEIAAFLSLAQPVPHMLIFLGDRLLVGGKVASTFQFLMIDGILNQRIGHVFALDACGFSIVVARDSWSQPSGPATGAA